MIMDLSEASSSPEYRYLPKYQVLDYEDSRHESSLKIEDLVYKCDRAAAHDASNTPAERSDFCDDMLRPRTPGTKLRWIKLRDTSLDSFRVLSKFYPDSVKHDIITQLFQSSTEKLGGIHRYTQDYKESRCTLRVPETGYSDEGSAALDPQLAIFFPFFQIRDSHSQSSFPGLVSYAQSVVPTRSRRVRQSTLPIVVQQMWLFVLGSKTIVTYLPPDESRSYIKNPNLENSIHHYVHTDTSNLPPSYRDVAQSAYVMAAHMVRRAALLNIHGLLVNTQLLPMLEKSVNLQASRRDEAYDAFSALLQENLRSPRLLSQRTSETTPLLLDVMSCVEELKSFLYVLDCQINVLNRMKIAFTEESPLKLSLAVEMVSKTIGDMNQLHSSVTTLRDNAIQIQESMLQLLDLQQKEANILEAQFARIRADEAAQQSRIILVFTVFTVIFLPISFFTSYFGMNVNEFTGHGGTSQGHFWMICGPIWIVIVLLAFAIAFYREVLTKLGMYKATQ